MSAAPLNPFASQTVSSLRRIEPPLRWLNDAALRKLSAVFELVEEKPHRCELVQVVLSRGDGYGKSHLLGRLIQELDGRATCVSVAPYHDALTCWVTLLQSMLNELSQPELIHHLPYPPTALDELAHHVFGFLTVMLADKGMTDTNIPAGLRDDILTGAFEKWDLADPASPLGIWVNETLNSCEQDPALEAIMVRLLKAATLHPYNDDASAMNWLLVLHRYASDRTDEDSRQMCLEWILTNQLEIPAESFLQNEEQLAGNNLIARQQTLDLLALAKLYRPFLLCFDQTHDLTSALAKSFGNMFMDLVRAEGAHFSIVTANSNHWESTVLPELGPDILPCLATKMDLAGLTREQGRSLAEQRLQSNGDAVELQDRLLNKDWLQEQFAQGLLGQREFLRRCQARYQELVPEAINPPEDVDASETASPHFEPHLDSSLQEDTVPDLNAAGEPVPSIEAESIFTEDLPQLPAMDIADVDPEKIEPILETPSETAPISAEPDLIPTTPVVEPPIPAEIIDTVSESITVPFEALVERQETDHAIPQISTSPVVESPAPAEIIDDSISESITSLAEVPRQQQDTEDATAETPAIIEQVPATELVTWEHPLTEQASVNEAPYRRESSTLIPLLPDNYSALIPLVEIIGNQTKERGESEFPTALLPPAQEEFLSESIETSDLSDAENSASSIQELAQSLSEPEKVTPEETPAAITSPVIDAEFPAQVEFAGVADPAPSEESSETKATTWETESGALASQPLPLSPPEAVVEVPTDTPGAIQNAPLIEEVEEMISPAALLTDEPSIHPAPDVAAAWSEEFEPQNIETAPENTQATEPQDLADASVVEMENEPDTTISAESTPTAEDAGLYEPKPLVTANDQAELREALLQIIKAHRFASHIAIADELRRKMQRFVSAEEAILCAQSISEIHVYADGPNAAFLWQGAD
ncbi:hypothetical protein BH11VER1_BH11VER1_22280 [soil metagenome]